MDSIVIPVDELLEMATELKKDGINKVIVRIIDEDIDEDLPPCLKFDAIPEDDLIMSTIDYDEIDGEVPSEF